MKPVLCVAYQVVYYDENGCRVYWPADSRSEVLAERLREARERGLNARLSQTAPNLTDERLAA